MKESRFIAFYLAVYSEGVAFVATGRKKILHRETALKQKSCYRVKILLN